MNIPQIIAAGGTVIATTGAIAIILVAVRSKLPAATIQIQNDSIRALQEQNKLLKDNVVELTHILTELKVRVSVLETIPLQKMVDNLDLLSSAVVRLEALAHENQTLIKATLVTPGQANITINK